MFRANVTLDDLLSFVEEKQNLVGGKKFTKATIKRLVRENDYDMEIVYDHGNIMVVDVTSPEAIKEIGCNSLWCFTYGKEFENAYRQWNNYSTNDHVYVIIDFSVPSDSIEFMHVLIKPVDFNVSPEDGNDPNENKLFNMANEDVYDPVPILEKYVGADNAPHIFNFGEPVNVTGPNSKWPYEDPNQLKLDLQENKILKSKFSNLDLDDIKFDSKVSYGHMGLKLVFSNPELDKYYNKLMQKDFKQDGTYLDLETRNMNHIHISAIPYALRNIGLGKLIYRKMLQEVGYISTGFAYARISEDAQRVWESLIKSGEYYYFKSKDNIRVTLAEKYGHPAIYEHILEYYGDQLEETNFDKSEVSMEDWEEVNENINKIRKLIREKFLNEAKTNKFLDLIKDLIASDGKIEKYSKITRIKGWPKVPNSDGDPNKLGTLDLENNEYVSIDDKKLTLITGGDWQDPWVVEIGLKGGELQVLDYRKAEKGEYKKRRKQQMKSVDMTEKIYEDDPMHDSLAEYLSLVKKHLKEYSPWNNSYADDDYENAIIEGPKINSDKEGVYIIWSVGGHDKDIAGEPLDHEDGRTREESVEKRFIDWAKDRVWCGKDQEFTIGKEKYKITPSMESLGDDKVKYEIKVRTKE